MSFGVMRMDLFPAPLFTVVALGIAVIIPPASTAKSSLPQCSYAWPCTIPATNETMAVDGVCKPITSCKENSLQKVICKRTLTTTYVCCPKEEETGIVSPSWKISRHTLPNPKKEQWLLCGVFGTEYISGGKDAIRGESPWMAQLFYEKTHPDGKKTDEEPGCGGSLIARNFVLTAAHCTKNERNVKLTSVRLGDRSLFAKVEKAIPHPEFDAIRGKTYHDISLLRLADYQGGYPDIIPVCLPFDLVGTTGLGKDKSFEGFSAVVKGWGRKGYGKPYSKVLQQLIVPIKSQKECRELYQFNESEVENILCAGGEPGKNACQGDSGGPLVVKHGGTYYQVGVVAFGDEHCDTTTGLTVYARVTRYLEWIRSVVKNENPGGK